MKKFELLSDDDIDFIYNPNNSKKDKIKCIVLHAPSRDVDAMDKFVMCLETDIGHLPHVYLAKKFREAIDKKRLYPFSKDIFLTRTNKTQLYIM